MLPSDCMDVNTMRDESEIASAPLGDATLKGAAIFQFTCEHSLANMPTSSLFLLQKYDWRSIATNKNEHNCKGQCWVPQHNCSCLHMVVWWVKDSSLRKLAQNRTKCSSSSLHPYAYLEASVRANCSQLCISTTIFMHDIPLPVLSCGTPKEDTLEVLLHSQRAVFPSRNDQRAVFWINRAAQYWVQQHKVASNSANTQVGTFSR